MPPRYIAETTVFVIIGNRLTSNIDTMRFEQQLLETLNNFLDRFLPRMRKFYARRAALKKALDRSGLALQVR